MKLITEKPITDQELPLRKKFNELVLSQLPILKWEEEQKKKRKKMKL